MTPQQIEAFRVAYAAWMQKSRPALDEHRWKDAFVGFPTPELAPGALAPLSKPLAQVKLGLFTTAGLYIKGAQPAFDAANVEGDASYRRLLIHTPREQFGIAHDHYDHTSAEQDLNAVYPVEPLLNLVRAGRLGSVADVSVSTTGYCTQLDRIAADTGPRIAAEFKALGIDAVLHIPV